MKQVSRQEYIRFIKNYPRDLDFDCTGIFEPPLGTYNDFSNEKVWPESIVAKEIRDWMGDNGERDFDIPGKFWKYFIKEETK